MDVLDSTLNILPVSSSNIPILQKPRLENNSPITEVSVNAGLADPAAPVLHRCEHGVWVGVNLCEQIPLLSMNIQAAVSMCTSGLCC